MPTIAQLKEAITIAEKIQSLESELSIIIVGGSPFASAPAPASVPSKRVGMRTMSPEARARIAAAQKARWAKSKGTSTAPAKAPKKKGGLSPEGRARIVAALKARHAVKRKATG